MASLPAAQSRFRNWPRGGALVRWPGFGGAWIPPLILALILVVLFAKAQQYLACDAALLLFVLVLIVIIPGRVAVAISRRHAE
jgi:hypothetical protein